MWHSEPNAPQRDPGARIIYDPDRGELLAPLAGADGRLYATTDDEMLGLDGAGAPLDGWPFELERSLVRYVEFDCPEGDTGCAVPEFHPPLLSPQQLV